jgi:hypothetical protein
VTGAAAHIESPGGLQLIRERFESLEIRASCVHSAGQVLRGARSKLRYAQLLLIHGSLLDLAIEANPTRTPHALY